LIRKDITMSKSPRMWAQPLFLSILLLPALILPAQAEAARGKVLLPEGRPAAGSQISVPGIPGSVRADENGEFVIDERARPPFVLVVIGARGEIFPAVPVNELSDTSTLVITLEPTLRESVTVISGVAPNIEAPPAAGVSMVGREDLEERRPEHLVEALERTPGVEARGSGPAAVPVVRGLAGGRTLLLIDDARITAERRAGPSGTFIDPFALASVEVSRGPGSVAYGSDALGGVVHARPRDPVLGDSMLQYQLNTSAGGRSSQAVGVEFSHPVRNGALLALVRARQGDDAEDGQGRPIDNWSYEDGGLALRYMQPLSDGLFRAGLAIDRGRDIGVPAADPDAPRTVYPDERSDRLTFSYDGATSLFDVVELRASAGAYDITTNRETATSVASSTVEANDASLRFAATRMTGSGRLHAGVDWVTRFNLRAENETGVLHEVSIEDASKRDLGVFAIYDWHAAAFLSFSAGARVDHVQNETAGGGYFGEQSRSDTAPSGYVSASFTPRPSTTATLQVSSGYRDPTLSDRYFRGVSGRGFVTGNPELDPERSLQFDGALRWQSGQQSFALLAYQYRIENLVERYRSGADFQFRNRGEAVVRGAEVEFATPLPARFSLALSASVARGEADGETPLDDIEAPNAHAALRWSNERLSAFLHGFVYARDDRPGPVETERPGYATFDLGFGWRIIEAAELRLHVRNLADRTYISSADAEAAYAPGREIMIGLNGKL
jgi:iron complex outermembrane receptor protein